MICTIAGKDKATQQNYLGKIVKSYRCTQRKQKILKNEDVIKQIHTHKRISSIHKKSTNNNNYTIEVIDRAVLTRP